MQIMQINYILIKDNILVFSTETAEQSLAEMCFPL